MPHAASLHFRMPPGGTAGMGGGTSRWGGGTPGGVILGATVARNPVVDASGDIWASPFCSSLHGNSSSVTIPTPWLGQGREQEVEKTRG